MTQLSFTYAGHSANLDMYECSDPTWSTQALWMDRKFVAGPDGSRTSVPQKPAEYSIRVRRRGETQWEDVITFKYRPSRNPKDMHLPDRTVTRLIRQQLAQEAAK